mgnify:CR=1 FL=1
MTTKHIDTDNGTWAIANWRDMQPFGFNCLTGEACGLSLRMLVDITAPARDILKEWMGVSSLEVPDNWNSGSIGSVMMDHNIPVSLAVFCLRARGFESAFILNSGVVMGASGEYRKEYEALVNEENVKSMEYYDKHGTFNGAPHKNFDCRRIIALKTPSRNVHQMTQRTM